MPCGAKYAQLYSASTSPTKLDKADTGHLLYSTLLYYTHPQDQLLETMTLADDQIASSKLFDLISSGLEKLSPDEKKSEIKKVNGIFELKVKSGSKEGVWTIDLKKEGKVYKGTAKPKADVTISLSDETFQQLADGKLNGQKAFMSGKLKVKGNIMLATKLDAVLKGAQAKL